MLCREGAIVSPPERPGKHAMPPAAHLDKAAGAIVLVTLYGVGRRPCPYQAIHCTGNATGRIPANSPKPSPPVALPPPPPAAHLDKAAGAIVLVTLNGVGRRPCPYQAIHCTGNATGRIPANSPKPSPPVALPPPPPAGSLRIHQNLPLRWHCPLLHRPDPCEFTKTFPSGGIAPSSPGRIPANSPKPSPPVALPPPPPAGSLRIHQNLPLRWHCPLLPRPDPCEFTKTFPSGGIALRHYHQAVA
jgi:hypothetical protein